MAYDYWYVYQCVKSSETRGSSPIAGKDATPKKKPCGLYSVRATKEIINENNQPQARKCDKCGNRPRLNKGNVKKSPNLMISETGSRIDRWGVRRQVSVQTDVPDRKQRKEWAMELMNSKNRERLIESSNASEQTDEDLLENNETIEDTDEKILEAHHTMFKKDANGDYDLDNLEVRT